MSVAQAVRETYQEVWGLDDYGHGSPGERFVSFFDDMAQPCLHETVLDAGCGSGKGALALESLPYRLDVTMCDVTESGVVPDAKHIPFFEAVLWDDLRAKHGSFNYVYCCDVLEHIPEEFTMLTVARLLAVCKKGLFLAISLRPDDFGVLVGKPLHLTIKPYTWWRDNLKELGLLVESRDLIESGLFYLRPA